MPYKIDSIRIAGTKYDGRAKLTSDQRLAIKELVEKLGYSQRKAAAMFNVSRRLVQSILNPPSRTNTLNRKSPEYWREIKRRHRNKKKQLVDSGKLSNEKNKKKR